MSNSPISFQNPRFSNYSDPPYDSILLYVPVLRSVLLLSLCLLGYVDLDTQGLVRFCCRFLAIPVSGAQLVCSSRRLSLCSYVCVCERIGGYTCVVNYLACVFVPRLIPDSQRFVKFA